MSMQEREVGTGPAMYKALLEVIGGTGTVREHLDEPEDNTVAIATFADAPEVGSRTYSTVTLHGSPNMLEDRDIRVELLAVGDADSDELANVLTTCAFNVGKSGWLAAPGVVFPDVVRWYFEDTTTPHLVWVEPYLWPELSTVELEGAPDVHCLLGIPLTDAEVTHLHEFGYEALQDVLEAGDVGPWELHRDSTV